MKKSELFERAQLLIVLKTIGRLTLQHFESLGSKPYRKWAKPHTTLKCVFEQNIDQSVAISSLFLVEALIFSLANVCLSFQVV